MTCAYPSTLVSFLFLAVPLGAYSAPDGDPGSGLSADDPGVSCKQIKALEPLFGNGLYWIDPEFSGAPFEVYCDMTTEGGGWTLAVNSVRNSESSTTDMAENTGTPNLNMGHTRDLSALAIDAEAEIRHDIQRLGGLRLNASYAGRYHDRFPGSFGTWRPLLGHIGGSEGLFLPQSFGRDWQTSGSCFLEFLTPWYYGGCLSSIPTNPRNGSTQGPVLGSGEILDHYRIFVRELQTPFAPCHVAAGTISPNLNEWTMIGVPCVPDAPATVESVFGDDLNPAQYTTRWVVYRFDPSTNGYVMMGLDDSVSAGVGYWLKTLDSADIDIEGSYAVPTVFGGPECVYPEGCFEIPLATPPGEGGQFQMLGHAFPTDLDWADVRIVAGGVAYTPSAAQGALILSKTIFKYNGDAYDDYDDITVGKLGVLNRWEGFWVRTLASAPADIKLLIPRHPIPYSLDSELPPLSP